MSARGVARRPWWTVVLAGALVAVALLGPGPVRAEEDPVEGSTTVPPTTVPTDPAQDRVVSSRVLSDGVALTERAGPGPVRYEVVHVSPDAPVDFQAVPARWRVGWGRETTSATCKAGGGIACVNANFSQCPSCDPSHGAVVRNGFLLQTPIDHQYQVRRRGGRWVEGPWGATVRLEVVVVGPGDRRVVVDALPIDSVNTGPAWDRIVLHTRHWGPRTTARPGSLELAVRAPHAFRTGGEVRQRATPLRLSGDGDLAVPADGAVVTARGRGVAQLKALLANRPRGSYLRLVVRSPFASTGVSGHPTLLRDGVRADLDPGDGKVVRRHPRTLLGWDEAGSTWLVVVDGRQEASVGMTLHEATDLLVHLGATWAVNLDGGGSSTLATWCGVGSGWCVENQPSDGRERRIWVALAVVPRR